MSENQAVMAQRIDSPEQRAELPRSNWTKLRVLELFAEFFCLRTNDAQALLRDRRITASDSRSVRRTLSILHQDGFLYRVPHLDAGRDRVGIAYVYGLSTKGVGHDCVTGIPPWRRRPSMAVPGPGMSEEWAAQGTAVRPASTPSDTNIRYF
jgi:hypothetical protein